MTLKNILFLPNVLWSNNSRFLAINFIMNSFNNTSFINIKVNFL
uniref:Uncharacterized protein n=1 Tax=Megaselia scalaris TaxID=36166 RepID=T1GJK0_MEGSC